MQVSNLVFRIALARVLSVKKTVLFIRETKEVSYENLAFKLSVYKLELRSGLIIAAFASV